MHPNTNLGKYAQDTIILGPRPEVKVTVTLKMVRNTLHPKIYRYDSTYPIWDSYPVVYEVCSGPNVKTQTLRMDSMIKYQ